MKKIDLDQALINLQNAFVELNGLWKEIGNGEHLDGTLEYPFHKEFDEITHDVIKWVYETNNETGH